jgi:hypothetical protein
MFVCNDGSVKFYPQEAYEQICRLNPQAGDTISVRKLKKGGKVFFEAALVSDAQEPELEPAPPPRPAQPIVGTAQPHKPVRYATGTKAAFPPSVYAQGVPQSDSPLPITNGSLRDGQQRNGNANGATHLSGNAMSPTAKHLGECMKLAIDACLIAADYAHEKNFGLTFLGGDVKSLALSIYINDQKGVKQ